MSKLVATVGVNIGKKRYDEGERIDPADLSERQRRYLVAEGYALEVEDGQRLPPETKEALEIGAADPHPLIEKQEG